MHLYDVKLHLTYAFKNCLNEIEAKIASERIRKNKQHTHFIFDQVRCKISVFALSKVQEIIQLNSTLPMCSHILQKTMGIPCRHILQRLIKQKESLRIDLFHPIWHLINLHELKKYSILSDIADYNLNPVFESISNTFKILTPHKQQLVQQGLVELASTTISINDLPQIKSRGRPKMSKTKELFQNQATTCREPSKFEIITPKNQNNVVSA